MQMVGGKVRASRYRIPNLRERHKADHEEFFWRIRSIFPVPCFST